ncbi:DUF2784 family protein [Xylophilus sp. Kf1]|nr:DUF2784 family protein [Xylophilus sp. Kf1]
MPTPDAFRHLADAVLVVHVGVALFIVCGLAAVLLGGLRGWRWVRGLRFRLLHLAAIVYVALQSWFGLVCPLTWLESWLRLQAHQSAYQRGFIEDWLQRALYFEAPAWVFVLAYSGFAALVAASWWWVPPVRRAAAPTSA